MKQRTLVSLVVGTFALLGTGRADADSLRCKSGQIISSGDTLYEVAAACGDPDFVSHYVRYQTVHYRVPAACSTTSAQTSSRYPNLSRYYGTARSSAGYGCSTVVEETVPIVVDEWTYDFGRNRFVELVVFEQGRLQTVSTLGYSHRN